MSTLSTDGPRIRLTVAIMAQDAQQRLAPRPHADVYNKLLGEIQRGRNEAQRGEDYEIASRGLQAEIDDLQDNITELEAKIEELEKLGTSNLAEDF